MLKVKSTKQSVYSPRKSRQDIYHKYADDGKCKDVGPTMIMLKDEDNDRIDSPFPTAFSPTENQKSYSLDIDLDLDVPDDEQKETKSGMAELYAQVVPKSQRSKDKKNDETSKDTPVSNGDSKLTVNPYSQYAQVTPKSQREKPSRAIVPNGKPASNGQSDEEKLKKEGRSEVLSAIGSRPIVIEGNATYNESAEL